MASRQQPHALVFGASGISGYSLLNQLCQYPTPTSWQRISGTTNRPFDLAQSGLPKDTRLRVYSGIDLTCSVDTIVQSLKEKIENVETVTHVFFTAYIAKETRAELKRVNTQMLENSIKALDRLAPGLQRVILQTGGKGYGLEYPDKFPIVAPLKEDMPRIPKPWRDEVFYYTQVDTLHELSQTNSGSRWTFAEIRPDGIIGFCPGKNPMNMAQGLALYLSVFRTVHGKSAQVSFPGTDKGYLCKHSNTSQDQLSKMEIHTALMSQLPVNGAAFNVADEDKPVTWAQVWPRLCSLFGLIGVGPHGTAEQQQSMEAFVMSNRAAWEATCEQFSLRRDSIDEQGWAHTHFMLVEFDFDRWYDLSAARAVGFSESIDTVDAYRIAFERMSEANIIPKQYLE
ncbi:unnamed protein product [Penicillium salamii]|nr:unnamed protein product [Penicillium salamii]